MKKIKIIMFFVFLILIILCVCYKTKMQDNTIDKTKIIEISVIDKYNEIEGIHKNPEKEEYVLVDIVIDGIYYKDCGIRTKGQTIYMDIKKHKTNNYSYKVKLDYRNKNQNYKGITELHLNSSMHDATGIKEYLIYDIYNQMGIQTQSYCFGHLKLGEVDRGLITMVEVINENYIKHAYNYEHANLYKPEFSPNIEYKGADFRYLGENENIYKGIFSTTKTAETNTEDKQRLISVLKNINSSSDSATIEANFIDFDKIIKMVAINKTLANVDSFTRNSLRNFFIYEENGKIDIIAFDFDYSLSYDTNNGYWTQDIHEFNLKEDDQRIYSRITQIIIENEEYLKKYYKYVEESIQLLEKMPIEELLQKTGNLMNSNGSTVYSKEDYKTQVKELKKFILNRRNDYAMLTDINL